MPHVRISVPNPALCFLSQGHELSASNVTLSTDGGLVVLKRLIGQMINVVTARGPIDITALYGERLDLRSGVFGTQMLESNGPLIPSVRDMHA